MSSEISKQTEAVLLHHLQAFGAGDVDGILSDYTEDSILLIPDATARGPDEMRAVFTNFVTEIIPPGSDFQMSKQAVEGEVAYIVWSASSPNYDVPLGTDTFIVRDGKIMLQTFAGQIIPKNAS